MSSNTTYQNIPAENAEVSDKKLTTIGPEGVTPSRTQQVGGETLDTHRTDYNTAAEYAPIDAEESGTVAEDNAQTTIDMSSDTTYQNISPESAEVRDKKSTTVGPEGVAPSRTQQEEGENLDTHRTYYNTAAEYAPIDEEESGTVAEDNAQTTIDMSSNTTYQNISPENVEVGDKKSTTIGPEGIYYTYYNTAAEYAPIAEEESGTVAADNAQVIQRPDENTGTDGSDTAKVPVNDAPPNQQTVNDDTLPDDIGKQSTKKSRKAPSFYDNEMYSMVGPEDNASSNGSQDDKASSRQSLSKKKRPKKKMKACLKYGIPTAMVFLTTIVVAVTLRHFGMFPNIIDMIIPGRWHSVYLRQQTY